MLILGMLMVLFPGGFAQAVELADTPMVINQQAAPPNLMFVYDNSGSMDWEFMTDDTDGKFEGYIEYLFDDPGDNNYSTSSSNGTILSGNNRGKYKSQWSGHNKIFYDPTQIYKPWPGFDNVDIADLTQVPSNPNNPGSALFDLTANYHTLYDFTGSIIVDNSDAGFSMNDAGDWLTTSTGTDYGPDYAYNDTLAADAWTRWTPTLAAGDYEVYVWFRSGVTSRSRDVTYTVGHSASGGPLGGSGGHDADNSTTLVPDESNDARVPDPISHHDSDGQTNQWVLLGEFSFVGDGTDYVELNAVDRDDDCCDYTADAVMFVPAGGTVINIKNAHYYIVVSGDVYLANFDGGVRTFYKFTDADNDEIVEDGELEEVTDNAVLDSIRPRVTNEDGTPGDYISDADDLQNFANWYSYYRRRELTAKAAVANSIYDFERANIGFYTINSGVRIPVKPVQVETDALFVDNQDANAQVVSGTWSESSASNEFRGSSLYASGSGSVYRWTPNITQTQEYRVYAWWTIAGTRDTNALYSVYHDADADGTVEAGEVTHQRVNQQNNAAEFSDDTYLGTFIFPASGGGYVTVTRDGSSTGTSTSADAIRVEPVSGSVEVDSTPELLADLYGINSNGSTPLRAGLGSVGRYFHTGESGGFGDSPYSSAADGGGCQRSFAITMTDGYYNGSAPSGIGNQDGGMGEPYEDGYSDTLADIAMKYYKDDIAPALPNELGASKNGCDTATYQHMTTYSVSFGVTGTIDPNDINDDGVADEPGYYNSDPCLTDPSTPKPVWPNPQSGNSQKIDDLWHAAVNGRGLFFSASNPQELVESLVEMMTSIKDDVASGASVSVNGLESHRATDLFQATYDSGKWIGDVIDFPVSNVTGGPDMANPKWKASSGNGNSDQSPGLDNMDWDTERLIITSSASGGVPFRAANVSLDPDPTINAKLVEFIRGRNDIAGYRTRSSILGDIVHSAPVIFQDSIYVGANDGMLHVFNAENGFERFAFVPSFVHDDLKNLADPNYNHQYYVDMTPTVEYLSANSYLLVGGLGKGGKGYYAIDVSAVDSFHSQKTDILATETTAAAWVKWQYPAYGATDYDMGYSYGRASIAQTNRSTSDFAVVFGNGYNSANGTAVLYILEAGSGALLKKIDTGVGSVGDPNGLSTANVVDVNNDYTIDYVYAGDLYGNLWKFDLRSSDMSDWDVAFKDSYGNNQPLFASGQPITTRPGVMFHCDQHGYMVVFGTGQYLGLPDRSDNSQQTVFGVWDYGDDSDDGEYLGTFDRATAQVSNHPSNITLLEQTVEDDRVSSGTRLRTLSDNEAMWTTVADADDTNTNQIGNADQKPNPAATIGWFFDLPDMGERVVVDIRIWDGKAIVISFIPEEGTPCKAGGKSMVHEMDACDGSRLNKPNFDINDDMAIDEQDLITITDGSETSDVPPTGIEVNGMIFPPAINPVDPLRERKNFAGSTGNIVQLDESPAKRGAYFWQIH
jgi:hypothetical protein